MNKSYHAGEKDLGPQKHNFPPSVATPRQPSEAESDRYLRERCAEMACRCQVSADSVAAAARDLFNFVKNG